ncbi:MAG: hypothetical protein ACLGIN_15905 [Candidatus Sericytochromatia bacterium]
MKRSWKQTLAMAAATLVLTTGLTGCGSASLPNQTGVGSVDRVELIRRGPGGQPRFMARNVVFRLDKDIAMLLEDMNADVVLKDPTMPFVPANKTEFSLQIHQAKVHKGAKALEALMNKYVFNTPDSPIKDVELKFKGDKIVMGGKMKKGIWVGFEMEGTLEPTPDGKIMMTPTLIKSMGMRVDGLMNLIGLEMTKLLKMQEEKGLSLQGNQIIMDPSKMYPPPALLGRVSSVHIANGQLHLEFNDGKARPWPDVPVKNQRSMILMWGGDILINKTLVLDAKMQILDATPDTPMVYAMDFYREQLEAGYTVSTRAGHMITYGPDINTWTGNLGRFAPPVLPIPGMPNLPSDMEQDDDARMNEGPEPSDPYAPRVRSRR